MTSTSRSSEDRTCEETSEVRESHTDASGEDADISDCSAVKSFLSKFKQPIKCKLTSNFIMNFMMCVCV